MNRLISASAGSGKTHALTTQFLRLLHARHRDMASGKADTLRVETLLAATFTRKAAGEIFDRILTRLADAALSGAGLADLRDALGEPALPASECQSLLLHLCRSLHRVQVGTLDSFFQRLCRVYRHEAGLSGSLRMTDPNSPRCLALQKDAVARMLDDLGSPEEAHALFETLTRQKASSPVVPQVLALLQDVSEAASGAEPHHWEQLRVPPRPPQAEVDAAASRLQAAGAVSPATRLTKAIIEDLARFRAGRWEDFLEGGLAKPCLAETYTYYKAPLPAALIAEYAVLLAVARHALLRELRERTLMIRDCHAKFAGQFAALRRAEGLVLFSETPGILAGLLGDTDETARRLGAPVEHLLLDEFQDTSDAQWGLLQSFARKASDAPGSLFVVGDAKQAIYGWRGGRAEIFAQLQSEIAFSHETLETSYRSSSVVLSAVNAVFAQIAQSPLFEPGGSEAAQPDSVSTRHQRTAEQWGSFFRAQQAARALPGFVELCVSPVPTDPTPAPAAEEGDEGNAGEDSAGEWNAAGASVHLVQSAARIAAEISLLASGVSTAVLVRTNKALAQMTDLLRARGVPVSSEGVGKVADDPAVELILSALLLADHPGHSAAAYHVACSPLGAGLGLLPPDCADPANRGRASAAIRRRVLSQGYAGMLAGWARVLAPHGAHRTARRLEQVVALAADLDAQCVLRASEMVRAIRESSAAHPEASSVRVMTINRAKGLEFDVVFLPDLEWRRPSLKTCLVKRADVGAIAQGASRVEAVHARPSALLQKLDPALLALTHSAEAEELTGLLCLLYVAMTRPRHALHLYVCPHKLKRDGSPERPDVKPAALLRAALCGSADWPAQGTGWTPLWQAGDPHWRAQAPPPAPPPHAVPPDAPAPVRPALRLRAWDGLRPADPLSGPAADAAPRTAASVLGAV